MHPGLHRTLLRLFQQLPTPARRRVVRTISPSFTVGSMCFIERADGALLLVEHVYRRRWGVPGGLLERREDPADAALREVREEVGLDVVLVGEPAVVVDPVPQRVDVVYRARVAPGCDPDAAAPRSPEIRSLRWFPPRDLPELQHETAGALVALGRIQGGADDARATAGRAWPRDRPPGDR
ncbi:NUDIX hydrolase [Iamia majanohamensis]|uniref:NUDIX hydrolase n=1 Tax=Iamia majanohamensis TaxID=467976 RepID=A0AAE9Y4W8_9ACTN|nr:NUDIX hydrolase [Iamia majanohamensis]WCO65281.1 NUDIX hydrolase [Iamia majanohamensis]